MEGVFETGATSLISRLTLPQSQLGICDPTVISYTHLGKQEQGTGRSLWVTRHLHK